MKKTYYLGALSALLMFFTLGESHAQQITPVGLHAETVKMSGLQQLKKSYMLPAYAAIESLARQEGAPFLDATPMEGEQTLGGGLIYGSEIEKLGLQLTYLYFMTAAIAIGGDLSFFFPETIDFIGSTFKQTLITLNVVAHYVVFSTLILRAYVLAGLNYAIFRSKTSGEIGSFSDSSSEIGLNLGGGIEYALAAGLLYLELKYIISNFDQLVISVGYRHKLGQ